VTTKFSILSNYLLIYYSVAEAPALINFAAGRANVAEIPRYVEF